MSYAVHGKIVVSPLRVHGSFLRRYFAAQRWRLEQSLPADLGAIRTMIPAGFTTDWASIPRIIQWLFPAGTVVSIWALIHDWLYFSGLLGLGFMGKCRSDWVAFQFMKASGESFVTRWTVLIALTIGAWPAWWGHRHHRHEYWHPKQS